MTLGQTYMLLIVAMSVLFIVVAVIGIKKKNFFGVTIFAIFFVAMLNQIYGIYEFRSYEQIFDSDRIKITCLKSNNVTEHPAYDLLQEVEFSVTTHRNYSDDVKIEPIYIIDFYIRSRKTGRFRILSVEQDDIGTSCRFKTFRNQEVTAKKLRKYYNLDQSFYDNLEKILNSKVK